jgi:SAM-dependent methyltransferase
MGSPLNDRRVVTDPELARFLAEDIRRLTAALDRPLDILEAGCGRGWGSRLDLAEGSFHLTGVDLDEGALSHRVNVVKDLDRSVVGDLRDRNIVPSAHFDVIYSKQVLEHVEGAETVLDNFLQWLRPDGVIIVHIPDRDTVFGFLGRTLPHKFHVMYERWFLGNRQAGKPGHGPYVAVYDPVIGLKGMQRFCSEHELTIDTVYRTHICKQPWSTGPKWRLLETAITLAGILSLGQLDSSYNDVVLVIQRVART